MTIFETNPDSINGSGHKVYILKESLCEVWLNQLRFNLLTFGNLKTSISRVCLMSKVIKS